MKKQTAAALLLLTVPAFAGAATLQDTATAGTTTYTKHWVLHETASHGLGKYDFAGTDKVRSRASGKLIGFDSNTGHFDPKTNTGTIQAAFALKGGLLLARAHFKGDGPRFTGRVTGGTGAYRGAHGTLSGRDAGHGKAFINLTYTL